MFLNGCTCNLHPTVTFVAIFHIDPHFQLALLKAVTCCTSQALKLGFHLFLALVSKPYRMYC